MSTVAVPTLIGAGRGQDVLSVEEVDELLTKGLASWNLGDAAWSA